MSTFIGAIMLISIVSVFIIFANKIQSLNNEN